MANGAVSRTWTRLRFAFSWSSVTGSFVFFITHTSLDLASVTRRLVDSCPGFCLELDPERLSRVSLGRWYGHEADPCPNTRGTRYGSESGRSGEENAPADQRNALLIRGSAQT